MASRKAVPEARLAPHAVRRSAEVGGAPGGPGVQPAHVREILVASLGTAVTAQVVQHLLVPADLTADAVALRALDHNGRSAATHQIVDIDHSEDDVEVLVVVDNRLRGLVAREHIAPERDAGHERVRNGEGLGVERGVERCLRARRRSQGEHRHQGHQPQSADGRDPLHERSRSYEAP